MFVVLWCNKQFKPEKRVKSPVCKESIYYYCTWQGQLKGNRVVLLFHHTIIHKLHQISSCLSLIENISCNFNLIPFDTELISKENLTTFGATRLLNTSFLSLFSRSTYL